MSVRTRVAPSPTGYAHLGLIYQAMFNRAFTNKFGGQFILRIEDTDRNRFVQGAEEVILDSLKWANLETDEGINTGGDFGPYRQSEKLELYKKHALELVDKDLAYYCFCSKERLDEMRKLQEANHQAPKYDKTCRNLEKKQIEKNLSENIPHVIRMKIPDDRVISFNDAIVGTIEIKSELLDDQIIVKADGFPTYHLAVVVDDYYMKITHVFRGTEWIPSTPKHVLLWEYLGWSDNMPKFAHLPLLLNTEGGGKLSKRQNHTSVDYYRKEGFLPEAVVNYLANVVWNHPENLEIFDIKEFEKAFELDPFKVDVTSTGAKFDLKKLEWLNGEYIRAISDEILAEKIYQYLSYLTDGSPQQSKEQILKVTPLIKERIKKLSDFIPLTYFLWEKAEYDIEVFNKIKIEDKKKVLEDMINTLESLPKPWQKEQFESTLRNLCQELDLKPTDFFQLLRVAISGQLVTPPMFECMQLLGEEESLTRIKDLSEKYPNLQIV